MKSLLSIAVLSLALLSVGCMHYGRGGGGCCGSCSKDAGHKCGEGDCKCTGEGCKAGECAAPTPKT